MRGWFDPVALPLATFDPTVTTVGWVDKDLVNAQGGAPPPTAPPKRTLLGVGR